ncbi:MAG: class I SAM-dependent methyltransferase [Acidobacteriota bacterium]
MNESTVDGAASPFVRRVLQGHSVETRVALADEMLLFTLSAHDWDFAIGSYFDRGRQAFVAQSQIERHFLAGHELVETLEFASGFGRATRFLLQLHGPDALWTTDIQKEAVEFQKNILGCQTVSPALAPADFNPGRNFDCVLAHSFFSHIPQHRFGEWMEALNDCVAPDGILVFSVHDESLLESGAGESGITFASLSESNRLNAAEYGTTWVSPDYVGNVIQKHCSGRSMVRWPRGLANFQDLYIVFGEHSSVGLPAFDQGPFGFASIARMAGADLDLIGWASHWNPARSVARIVVEIGGHVLGETEFFFPRQDVVDHLADPRHLNSGWHLRMELPRMCSAQTDVVAIRAISDLGTESFLYLGTVADLLLASCRSELAASGRLRTLFLDQDQNDPLEELYRSR